MEGRRRTTMTPQSWNWMLYVLLAFVLFKLTVSLPFLHALASQQVLQKQRRFIKNFRPRILASFDVHLADDRFCPPFPFSLARSSAV